MTVLSTSSLASETVLRDTARLTQRLYRSAVPKKRGEVLQTPRREAKETKTADSGAMKPPLHILVVDEEQSPANPSTLYKLLPSVGKSRCLFLSPPAYARYTKLVINGLATVLAVPHCALAGGTSL